MNPLRGEWEPLANAVLALRRRSSLNAIITVLERRGGSPEEMKAACAGFKGDWRRCAACSREGSRRRRETKDRSRGAATPSSPYLLSPFPLLAPRKQSEEQRKCWHSLAE